MEQRNDFPLVNSDAVPAADLAAALSEAQERAAEQRSAVEQLLAEARALEERLAREALRARAAAERGLARNHAAAAVAAAGQEREAISRVEACAATIAELTKRAGELEKTVADSGAAKEAAAKTVADYEARLEAARANLARAEQAWDEAQARRSELALQQAAVETEAAAAADILAEHRSARQRFELESNQAEERARALGAPEGGDSLPSLEPVEELRLLEARVALRAEAAKRAAERRASDAARNHVAH